MTQHERKRRRLRVTGIVQGVGFRPYVYGLARRLSLTGYVLNDSDGVVIEVEGAPASLTEFRAALETRPPPLAAVENIADEDVPTRDEETFEIHSSARGNERRASISPDVATCDECLREITDPRDRRHLYAFANCTNCGPRFTITTDVPYDRPNTTMASFEMCAVCRAEYADPGDRRFHAQPIACPRCGPQLRLLDRHGAALAGDPIAAAARALRSGDIVAVKGLGGYHLACDATSDGAVLELRRRKARDEKPFAVMVQDLGAAAQLAEVDPDTAAVLGSRRRPIVLAARREGAPLAAAVAPGNRFVGLMLPYTPLHHLLLAQTGRPIVLTSGNLSDEPIAYRDTEALERLRGVADLFLVHDRAIRMRCDDSVVRVLGQRPYPIRRARGYAPEPLLVEPRFARPVLAAGPELKHTFCLGVGGRAILSHHIGDLESFEAMSAFTEGIEHYERVFDVRPEVVGFDLHAEYLATKWAQELESVDKIGVQHHHAHIAACLADNRRTERVLGLALDGTGYGEDGSLWGCELLACDLRGFVRLAHLAYVAMPGGAAAIREPWRLAAVYLERAYGERAVALDLHFVSRTRERWPAVLQMAKSGLNSPMASSAGRLFDAAAALCDIRDRVSYEGQAAAELEQAADPSVRDAYPCTVDDGEIDGVELIAALADDLGNGAPVALAAARFHNGLASALVRACASAREREGLETVALSGGTWQNLLLLERARSGLEAEGFEVLVHERVPVNDGGIALGQAVVAGARSVTAP